MASEPKSRSQLEHEIHEDILKGEEKKHGGRISSR